MAPVEPGNGMSSRSGDPSGAGASARLLLALTALYVQRSNHGAEEQQQFTVLALGLIERAGPAACAAAAVRLRGHPDAPAAVIERLAQAGRPATAGDAEDGGPDDGGPEDRGPEDGEARASAARLEAAAARPGCETGPQEGCRDGGAGRERVTPEFGEAFFAASPAARRAMLSAVGAGGIAAAPTEEGGHFHGRIDVSPWRGRTGAFARDFERLIDAPASLSERILNDPSGEPLVVAARAAGLPLGLLQRILVLVSPAMHPVERVWDLSELYHAIDAGTARSLLAVWRTAAEPAAGQAADPQPIGQPADEAASGTASETASETASAAASGSAGDPADGAGGPRTSDRAADEVTGREGEMLAATNLRARLRALNARIDARKVVTARPGPGNAGRRDPLSR